VRLRCPDCERVLEVKPPADTRPGTKVGVTCACGSKLRFEMPRTSAPTAEESARRNSGAVWCNFCGGAHAPSQCPSFWKPFWSH